MIEPTDISNPDIPPYGTPAYHLYDAKTALTIAKSFCFMTTSSILSAAASVLVAASTHLRRESDIIDARVDLLTEHLTSIENTEDTDD